MADERERLIADFHDKRKYWSGVGCFAQDWADRACVMLLADADLIARLPETLDAVAENVCGNLPIGWYLDISMENGAAYVDLRNPDGESVEIPLDLPLCDQVHYAIDAAIAASSTGDAGEATNGNV